MWRFACALIAVTLAGCAKTEQADTVQNYQDSSSAIDTAKTEAQPVVFSADTGSPRIVVDSVTKEPRMVVQDRDFVLRLPLAMARTLADSLPGFVPFKRSAYDTEVVSWMDHIGDRAPPSLDPADSDAVWAGALSVIVGDFNGDSKRDVAMDGVAGDTFATFFLLSSSDERSPPTLLYFTRPSKGREPLPVKSSINFLTLQHRGKVTGFEEEGDPPVVDLHADAVQYVIFGKASELYYIEDGVVRVMTTSD